MKPTVKNKRVKKPVIAVYLNNTSVEFKKDFFKTAKRLGLSASSFGNMCIRTGYEHIVTNLDDKKISRTNKKKMVA